MIEVVIYCLIALTIPPERWDYLDSLQVALSQSELTSDAIEQLDLYELKEDQSILKPLYMFKGSRKFFGFPEESPSIDLKLRSSVPAFVPDSPHPSTYRGGSESATARLSFRWGKWTIGSAFDKDAYEPRWDDLSRFYLVHENDRMKIVAGDFNVVSGLGLTFWNRPLFASTSNFVTFAGQDGFRLTPASNTSANRALRGFATHWAGGSWQFLTMISDTRYDAIKGSDGSVLRLSDGGYHRSFGEEIKRETLGEQLAGIAAQSMHSIGDMKFKTGIMIWGAHLSPELEPVPSPTDPFPLSGKRTGATGLNLAVERGRAKLEWEIAGDRKDNYAGAFQTVFADLPWKTKVKATGFYFPSLFSNPHAAEIAGRQPKGKTALGMIVDKSLSIKYFNNISATVAMFKDKFPSTGDAIPKTRTELSLAAKGNLKQNRWEARIFNRNESVGDANMSIEKSVRVRCQMSKVLSDRMKVISWVENAAGNSRSDRRLHGWAAGGSLRARIGNNNSTMKIVTPAVSVRNTDVSDDISTEFRASCTWFKTSGLPIYEGDISYPDRVKSVRLYGSGLRLTVEIVIFPVVRSAFSLKAARTYPINSSTRGDGELYLSFTLKT